MTEKQVTELLMGLCIRQFSIYVKLPWVSCYAEMVPLVKTKAAVRLEAGPVDISQRERS